MAQSTSYCPFSRSSHLPRTSSCPHSRSAVHALLAASSPPPLPVRALLSCCAAEAAVALSPALLTALLPPPLPRSLAGAMSTRGLASAVNADAARRVQKMVRFILHDAQEKAEEIEAQAQHDAEQLRSRLTQQEESAPRSSAPPTRQRPFSAARADSSSTSCAPYRQKLRVEYEERRRRLRIASAMSALPRSGSEAVGHGCSTGC